MKSKPVLGLTMGDPAGIGPEICLHALHDVGVREQCVPVLFGDIGVLERLKSSPAFSSKSNGDSCRVVSAVEFDKISEITRPLIVDCGAVAARKIQPGKISGAAGRAGYVYIERAIAASLAGKTRGVITGPIHKEALNLAG